jgi:hypothetical protein
MYPTAMPHGGIEWRKVNFHDLHDISYFCDIRTFAKAYISHERAVRLIMARESGWGVEVLTTLFPQSKHASNDLHSSITWSLLCVDSTLNVWRK